jgi:parallel beta-helix repeat protein
MGFDDLYGATTITNTTISGNTAQDQGGGIYVEDANGQFAVSGSQITGNTGSDGGGVYVDYGYGAISFVNSTISGNTASDGWGGGLYMRGTTGGVEITNSTIADNQASSGGGGIEFWNNGFVNQKSAHAASADASLVITDSTISGNHANDGNGGGLYAGNLGQPLQVFNSTISGNTASGEGGGIAFAGYYLATDMMLVQTTISNNSATSVGGVYLPGSETPAAASHRSKTEDAGHAGKKDKKTDKGVQGQARVHARADAPINVALVGTILALNHGLDLGDSGIVTSDHSLLGTVSATTVFTNLGGTILGLDPLLGPLADNGGPTQTQALSDVSPAVNAGPDPVPPFTGNAFDQRGPGFPRVTNNRVDIGAYETPQVVVILPTFTG